MDCLKIQDELLPAYVFNDLDKETKEEVKRHLLTCFSCQKELAGLEETVKLFKAAVKPDEVKTAPAGLLESLYNICPRLTVESMLEKIKQKIRDFLEQLEQITCRPELAYATRGGRALRIKTEEKQIDFRPIEVKSELPITIYSYNHHLLGFIFDNDYRPMGEIKVVMERVGLPSFEAATATTDLDGMFSFRDCRVGNYTLNISIPQKEPIKISVTI